MRAGDLATPFPTVGPDTGALEAAKPLARVVDAGDALMARTSTPLVAVAGNDGSLVGSVTLDVPMDRLVRA